VLILALFPIPYQQILPFLDRLALKLTGVLGAREREREKKKEGKE
jgi:hypothetical protein